MVVKVRNRISSRWASDSGIESAAASESAPRIPLQPRMKSVAPGIDLGPGSCPRDDGDQVGDLNIHAKWTASTTANTSSASRTSVHEE